VSIAYKQVHDAPQPLVQIVADVPRAYEAIVAKLLAKDPAMRYPTAGALRDHLRRFRSDQPVEALVAAQNAQGRAAGAAAAAGAVAGATTVNPTAAPTTVGPSMPPRSATVPSTGMIEAGYPTGASADAMYYDTNQSKTGWYAIAAFLALIVLVVGGVLLFQALSGNDSTDEPTQFILADYTNPPQLLADVTADLDSLGIRYETIAEESAVVPVGFVHRTDPVAGTVILADQTVKVYFNPDPQLVPVPGVVGLTLEAARLKLEGEGFKIGDITIEKTDEVAENTVISTDPAADTPALQGSTVAIVVAGPPDSVQVPGQVVGMTEIDARALLEAPPYQFTVTTAVQSSSTIPEGTVIEINPGPGALVLIGSDVTIVVSTGPQPVSVPSVIGQTEGRARNSLTSSGLVVRVTFQDVPAGSPDDGRVIDQSLPADSVVQPGTEITITVARSVQVAPTPPPTTVEPTTTVPPTTAAPTTVAPTTLPPTTVPPTTVL